MPTHALTEKAVVLRPEDDVAIAKAELSAGVVLEDGPERLQVRSDVHPGHKLARRAIRSGDPVRRYGQIIGYATADIQAGDHVHTHNLGFAAHDRKYEFGTDVIPVTPYPPEQMRFFDGFKRSDGRVGTRNYVAIVSTVNCSASVSRFVQERFADVKRDFPNVDGVLAITHKSGCGVRMFGEDHELLQRVLAGYARHPNVAAYVVIGLGCEVNQAPVMVERQGMKLRLPTRREGPPVITIQESGGVKGAVARAVEEVAKLLPLANEARRTPQPVSEIVLATNCGGSDGNSGITANPALGWAVDELVRYGGTGVLAETPEIYGAEHLLTRRARNAQVGQKLVDIIHWWQDYCARNDGSMDNNPSPGNKQGGLTTILEKSLGAAAKGGTTTLTEVYRYAEPVTAKGFVYMDTPGYDPVAATGQVAGGCNVLCFTTGRGSAYGCKPTPSIKLATNHDIYRRMLDDMDINCGDILDGVSIEAKGQEIFDTILRVASGEKTKSELLGYGDNEFVPWQIGATM
jgi:altronate hydrolase